MRRSWALALFSRVVRIFIQPHPRRRAIIPSLPHLFHHRHEMQPAACLVSCNTKQFPNGLPCPAFQAHHPQRAITILFLHSGSRNATKKNACRLTGHAVLHPSGK
jgi:hypothetical protein